MKVLVIFGQDNKFPLKKRACPDHCGEGEALAAEIVSMVLAELSR